MLMQGVTYNTVMGLAVGIIMVLVPIFVYAVVLNKKRSIAGFAWAFIMLGGFLGLSGLHMMLTWPLEQIENTFCCAVDNVTFGEPAAFFGLLTFFAGLALLRAEDRADRGIRPLDLVATLRPILYVGAIAGFGLIMFGIAGLHFGQWRPPNIEPIARLIEGSLLMPFGIFAMYVGTGISALLSPFALTNKTVARIFIVITWLIGMAWIFLGINLHWTHVGFFPYPFNEPVMHP